MQHQKRQNPRVHVAMLVAKRYHVVEFCNNYDVKGPGADSAVSGSPTIAEWSRRGLANRIDPKSHVVVTQHCCTSHIVGALGHSCV